MTDLHLAFHVESANYSLGREPNTPQIRMVPAPVPRKTAREILADVAERHKLRVSDLTSDRRTKQLTVPRFEAFYLMARDTKLSLPQIGTIMGGRDHTTALHGIRRHCELNSLPYPRARA